MSGGYAKDLSCCRCGALLYGLDSIHDPDRPVKPGELPALVCVQCLPISCPLVYKAPREPQVGEEIVGASNPCFHGLRFTGYQETANGRKLVLHRDGAPEKHFVALPDQYIQWWRFADDEGVRFFTDLELQLVAMKVGNGPHIIDSGNVPPCPTCKNWPCLEKEGCEDFYYLAFGKKRPQPKRKSQRRKAA